MHRKNTNPELNTASENHHVDNLIENNDILESQPPQRNDPDEIAKLLEITNSCFEPLDGLVNQELNESSTKLTSSVIPTIETTLTTNASVLFKNCPGREQSFRHSRGDDSFFSTPVLAKHTIELQPSADHPNPPAVFEIQKNGANRMEISSATTAPQQDLTHDHSSTNGPSQGVVPSPSRILFNINQTYYLLNGTKVCDFSNALCDPRGNHPYIKNVNKTLSYNSSIQYFYTKDQLSSLLPLRILKNDVWKVLTPNQVARVKEKIIDNVIVYEFPIRKGKSCIAVRNTDYNRINSVSKVTVTETAPIEKTLETILTTSSSTNSTQSTTTITTLSQPQKRPRITESNAAQTINATSPSVATTETQPTTLNTSMMNATNYFYLNGDPVPSKLAIVIYDGHQIVIDGKVKKFVYTQNERNAILPLRYLDGNTWRTLDDSLLPHVFENIFQTQFSRTIKKSLLISKLTHLDFVNQCITLFTPADYRLETGSSVASQVTDNAAVTTPSIRK